MLLGKVAPIQPPQVQHGHEVVKIVVGCQQEEFTIHKNLICAASEFVQAALNSNFIEGAKQRFILPEEDPQVFQMVYDWLYSGRVADGVTTYLKKEEVCSGDIFWWKVYHMGDRLIMDRLRVLAIAKLQHFFTTRKPFVPSKQFIEELFDNAKLPGLETYMVHHVVFWLEQSSEVSVWSNLADAHMRFGQALAKAVMLARGNYPVHPHAHTGGSCEGDGSLSPWKIVGVPGEPGKHTGGGGHEVRAKHMARGEVIELEDDGMSEHAEEEQVFARG
ncbi:hypothetical protein PV04_08160 [Phialophora macrospora]|uniref:BTB domain-containing protein n=1 Tax=Phialophora macrospora TaxID=1851006 RepID=A0A0D2DV22_9EURO|nr:hypothetical protein PV04_08160 [Phialophora macrospora]